MARLDELRVSSGMSARELFERILLSNEVLIKERKNKKAKTEYLTMLGQINRVGNNMNQIALHFNRIKGAIDNDELSKAIVLLSNIEDMLLSYIENDN